MRVDLHLHTWVSDGDLPPAELVRLAAAAGLDVIAVTDHDTAGGVGDALSAAADLPLSVVPGIEISTVWGSNELHILGYWIDPESQPIVQHQEQASRRRSVRMEAMVERLQGLGVQISFADVEVAAGTETRSLGRPHLARALHAGGHTRFYGEAFARYIGNSGPAYVAEGFPVPPDAIATIHAAGGLAVWAHPPLPLLGDTLPLMVEWGLDGVECYRPGTDPGDLAKLETSTRAHGLFPTGGSDWHGPHRAALGDFAVDAERVRAVLRMA
ncbi:MAG: PHP domain-containing protein [Gemmatimonadota bacterium]